MSRSGKTERHHISIRLYSGPELRDLLHQAGFARVELYGNPPLGRLVHSSRRLIAVAQKA